jgi:hypothetical protein
MDGGWSYFLLNLRHYLEQHAGKARSLAFERRPIGMPRDRVFPALFEALGAGGKGPPQVGAPVTLALGSERLDGSVALAMRDHLALAIPALDDGLVLFELEPGAKPHFGAYLSTYGTDPARAEQLKHGLSQFLDVLLPGGHAGLA